MTIAGPLPAGTPEAAQAVFNHIVDMMDAAWCSDDFDAYLTQWKKLQLLGLSKDASLYMNRAFDDWLDRLKSNGTLEIILDPESLHMNLAVDVWFHRLYHERCERVHAEERLALLLDLEKKRYADWQYRLKKYAEEQLHEKLSEAGRKGDRKGGQASFNSRMASPTAARFASFISEYFREMTRPSPPPR